MRSISWERWVDFDTEVNEHSEADDDSFDVVPLMVRTPLGTFSPYEQMTPTKQFDCWICHTNFDLNEGDRVCLDQVPGIEVLRIMSRYRFFIGIGKMFTLTEIRHNVEIALGIRKDHLISQIIGEISGKAKWALAVYEDGSHRTVSSDTDDEAYKLRLAELKIDAIEVVTSEEFT